MLGFAGNSQQSIHTKLPVKTSAIHYTFAAVTAALFSTSALAQTVSPVQAAARPDGLSIVEPVQAAGSDAASADFDANDLTPMRIYLNRVLRPGQVFNDSLHYLDPSKLHLTTMSDTRVYFLGEGAGYHNSLGFNASGSGVSSGNPKLIFPDASSPVSTSSTSWNGVTRSANEPLLPGDFVDLGANPAGTSLDFFIIGNGARGGRNVYSTNTSVNPDHFNHVVAFTTPGSPYLMIGFEDLYNGGDRDFNDVLFAVDIGAVNLHALAAAPEPSMWMALASFVLPVAWLKRRRDAANVIAPAIT